MNAIKPETECPECHKYIGKCPACHSTRPLSASPPAPSVPDVVLIDGVPYDRADLPKMVTELTRKWEDACTDAELYRDIESSSRRLLEDIRKVLDADPEDNLVMLIEGRLDEIKSYEEEAAMGEAALTAQAKTIEGLERKACVAIDDECSAGCIKENFLRLRQENIEMRRTFGSHPLFAEKDAKISAQAAEVERLRGLLDGRDDFIVTHQLWDEFVAALPSPPITKIKGEG